MDRKTAGVVVASVLGTLAVVGVLFLFLVYSGEYNVAATKPHYGIVNWALETTMEHSVRDHATEVPPPPPVDSAQLMTGFHHFQAMCVTCHGAPGVEPGEIGKGLLPDPPPLSEAVPQWTDRQLFWIVKHGIKMSGMPAFGPTHSDEEIWGIVAYLRQLPETSPDEYAALREATAGAGHHGGGGGHQHGGGHPHGGTGTGTPTGGPAPAGGGGGAQTGDGHTHADGHGHSH